MQTASILIIARIFQCLRVVLWGDADFCWILEKMHFIRTRFKCEDSFMVHVFYRYRYGPDVAIQCCVAHITSLFAQLSKNSKLTLYYCFLQPVATKIISRDNWDLLYISLFLKFSEFFGNNPLQFCGACKEWCVLFSNGEPYWEISNFCSNPQKEGLCMCIGCSRFWKLQ